MKNYKSYAIKVDDLQVNDDFRLAGVLYRVDRIERIGTAYIIQIYNARRPKLEGILTLEKNTLMKIRVYK